MPLAISSITMKLLSALLITISMLSLPGVSESRDQKKGVPPQITFTAGYPLLSISGVLRSIAQARGDIHDNKLQSAREALNDAHLQIEFIRESSPVTQVRDYIWVARKHLSLGDTEKAVQDLTAINLALGNLGETRFVAHARKFINRAMTSLEKKDKEGVGLELELTDKALECSGVDSSPSAAEGFITSAQGYLSQNEPEEAGRALRNAEDELQFVVIDLYTPLPKAREAILASKKNFADQEFGAARKKLDEAGHYLKKAITEGDDLAKAEAGRLLKDLAPLRVEVGKKAKGTDEHMESLWERVKALAERDAEYAVLVVRKAEKVNPVQKDIINAKMYVLYAESYHLTAGDSRKAQAEIDKAEAYLKNALSRADEATKPRLSEIEKELNGLRSELNERNEKVTDRYRHIEEELSHLIRKGKAD
jgi:cellobiose-specific phosphotransferase system component IIA